MYPKPKKMRKKIRIIRSLNPNSLCGICTLFLNCLHHKTKLSCNWGNQNIIGVSLTIGIPLQKLSHAILIGENAKLKGTFSCSILISSYITCYLNFTNPLLSPKLLIEFCNWISKVILYHSSEGGGEQRCRLDRLVRRLQRRWLDRWTQKHFLFLIGTWLWPKLKLKLSLTGLKLGYQSISENTVYLHFSCDLGSTLVGKPTCFTSGESSSTSTWWTRTTRL